MVELPADVGDSVEDGNGGLVESLRAELADYRDHLMAKDRQLEIKDQQIQQLQEMLNEARAASLHDNAAPTAPGKSWWRRLLG